MKRIALLLVFALTVLPVLLGADDAKPQADADGFYSLFNGKDLTGWKPNESPESFKVEDGHIVVNGKRAHLFYEGPVGNHDFKDFHFKAEVMTFPSANSGIYFHTKYQKDGWPQAGFESQVNNSQSDRKRTGGLYNVKDVMDTPPAKDETWFTYEIVVKGDNVKVLIDGKETTDWTQPADWKGAPGQADRKIGSGTFALQAHDPGSKVYYKNIKVKPLD